MIWSDVISPDSIPKGSLQSKSEREGRGRAGGGGRKEGKTSKRYFSGILSAESTGVYPGWAFSVAQNRSWSLGRRTGTQQTRAGKRNSTSETPGWILPHRCLMEAGWKCSALKTGGKNDFIKHLERFLLSAMIRHYSDFHFSYSSHSLESLTSRRAV